MPTKNKELALKGLRFRAQNLGLKLLLDQPRSVPSPNPQEEFVSVGTASATSSSRFGSQKLKIKPLCALRNWQKISSGRTKL
jgi:hypothetical protein